MMKNLYDDAVAASLNDDKLALRVYTSRLLGQSDGLVLHGGGNTSVKIGDTLYVKGSGWNLATIEKAGFSPVDLARLQKLATRERLSDTEMVKEQRAALRDPDAPNPSIEAILHAIIPFDYVDHTHADAVVTLSNTPDGKAILEELYGDRVLIVDYMMPGFILSRHIYEQTRHLDWNRIEGIVLMHHGLFTFDNDAKRSYDRMIDLVNEAETYIAQETLHYPQCISGEFRPDMLTKLTDEVSRLRKTNVTLKLIDSIAACTLSKNLMVEQIVRNGGLTPEHVIRIKPFPAVIDKDITAGIDEFVKAYRDYFNTYASPGQIMLDPAPRYAIIKGVGAVAFGKDEREAEIIADIVEHTIRAILTAEQLGGWKSLTFQELFAMEYWELEQAKLQKS